MSNKEILIEEIDLSFPHKQKKPSYYFSYNNNEKFYIQDFPEGAQFKDKSNKFTLNVINKDKKLFTLFPSDGEFKSAVVPLPDGIKMCEGILFDEKTIYFMELKSKAKSKDTIKDNLEKAFKQIKSSIELLCEVSYRGYTKKAIIGFPKGKVFPNYQSTLLAKEKELKKSKISLIQYNDNQEIEL